MTDQLAELRTLAARLGPSQALRAARRASMASGQRERLVRPSLAELTAMRAASQHDADDDQATALRRRQLELLKLTG